MTYPENDTQYEESSITAIQEASDGWMVTRLDGWSIFVPTSEVVPQIGMVGRFYRKGVGYRVRGIFLDGQKVFYRTEAEDQEQFEIDMYGADAADWLARWDAGRTVWSIEMGGLGPGYEQCIQIVAAETLRHMLDARYDASLWQEKEVWQRDRGVIEAWSFNDEKIGQLGISGAQWGAALMLAATLYMDGPRGLLEAVDDKKRHIQVSRNFPSI